ncbi:hypothetical protein BDD43_3550 [Mucilaginibacter gracilis]|uniref:TerB family tellurite resistance protein n=1 Tax=Mucilaginibacter gracilis TaxID=423350 RepID=A0A495J2Z6_9SPHI|nr:TerB family tellurite resistance protein [Mucilaginibacter gracilis]RKR83345.1 hypothetical protein BDD43_3550 [Mucilaginibacter gracilis]
MKCLKVLLVVFVSAFSFERSSAQSYEVQQLILDVEKLAQFKGILKQMYDGYSILTQGYGTVKNLTQGNFSLHQVFLDGLLQVSPEVRKYARIADIISDESHIVSEYKKAYSRFQNSGRFSLDELDYMGKVYGQLNKAALADLEELANVITAGKLRMSDDERLNAIDRIYADTNNKLQFLRAFNRKAGLLQANRQREADQLQTLKNMYHE